VLVSPAQSTRNQKRGGKRKTLVKRKRKCDARRPAGQTRKGRYVHMMARGVPLTSLASPEAAKKVSNCRLSFLSELEYHDPACEAPRTLLSLPDMMAPMLMERYSAMADAFHTLLPQLAPVQPTTPHVALPVRRPLACAATSGATTQHHTCSVAGTPTPARPTPDVTTRRHAWAGSTQNVRVEITSTRRFVAVAKGSNSDIQQAKHLLLHVVTDRRIGWTRH